jgi:hypothetical protein
MRRGRPRSQPQPGIVNVSEAAPFAPADENSVPGATPAEASAEARRLAAGILEVLAGARGPVEMAQVLGISLARYYQLERRALDGLLAACEPRRRGPGRRSSNEVAALRQECERLRRACARQQALVRAAQRAIGFPAPAATGGAPPSGSTGRKRRPRRPKARALKMAALLRSAPGSSAQDELATPAPVSPDTAAAAGSPQ